MVHYLSAIIEENEFGLPSLNDAASTAVIGASSVHSEPVTNNFRFKSSRKYVFYINFYL